MREDLDLSDLTRDDAHPKAQAALTDAFFWDLRDDASPFGNETGAETYAALRDARDEDPRASPLSVLGDLLARWEVTDGGWDVADEDAVQALGEDDEYSLLTRDEAILALAFGELVLAGRVDPEIRRRALVALKRQALPALLHGWGFRKNEREKRVERMREILANRWD